MGACISENKKTSTTLPSIKVKIVDRDTGNEELSSTDTSRDSSQSSSRLSEMKSRLPALTKGIEQRNRIMSMSRKNVKESSKSELVQNRQKSFSMPCSQVVEVKLEKQFMTRTDIFRETMKSLATCKESTSSLPAPKQHILCFECLNEINSLKYANITIEGKQHNLCKDCACSFTIPLGQNGLNGLDQGNQEILRAFNRTLSSF